MQDVQTAPLKASFRDPAGAVFFWRERIFRIVTESGSEELQQFLSSTAGQSLIQNGDVVASISLKNEAASDLLQEPAIRELFDVLHGKLLIEHERIPFPSYPYEWSAGMLQAAGKLTIDIAQRLLRENLGLKDATPYNILFRGPRPVFVDALSFEKRDPRDTTWLPYAQFVRTFLLPLLATKHFGVGLDQILISRRDGLEPEEVYRWMRLSQRFRPPFLSLVSIPKWLAGKKNSDDPTIYERKASSDPERAQFILESLFRRLRRTLKAVGPDSDRSSVWSDYMTGNNNYSASDFEAKQRIVKDALVKFTPKKVLDVGCNTGHFSALAAKMNASVVAIDYDPVVVDRVWHRAQAEELDILPLVVNLTRPSPGIGWLNAECRSFLSRAEGHFDCVLMLAVIHHMLVTERVPLPGILELASRLTTDVAVIEFIAPDDSMFQRLTRGRAHLHKDLTREVFEATLAAWFTVEDCQRVEGASRWMYVLRRRA
jgi:SAM-dependent methyltransferase